jgi:hypothetical protein
MAKILNAQMGIIQRTSRTWFECISSQQGNLPQQQIQYIVTQKTSCMPH